MYSILTLSFSFLLLVSCGKHEQKFSSKNANGNTIVINNLDSVTKMIVDEDIDGLEAYRLKGGDLNAELKTGRTILIESCFWTKLKVISYLIKNNVDISKKDRTGKTALDYADEDLQIRRAMFPELLIEQKKSLFLAIKGKQMTEIKKILEEKGPVNFLLNVAELGEDVSEGEGETLLTYCVKNKLELVIRLLTQPKYELDVNQRNALGETPLAISRVFKFSNIEKQLLRLGAIE